ncbi:hypothetical protein KP509_06G043000 [Ceratopteris richardii]|uniref:tRNA-uridine aminocarboxypropyltransferase n=2 Tax=Ceratopteris richardii TaxID=49495 RepID=A0A8T2UKB0_CERRI|nr:hypothetical protein KP509_06G043000 [Ceratopteris richardii]KAH7434970.1 hypothetical protein KP509_06G043000 [Ceratopteris richardii]
MLGTSWSVRNYGWLLPALPAVRSTRCNMPSRFRSRRLRAKAVVLQNSEEGEAAVVTQAEDFSKDWKDFGRCPPEIPPLVKRLIWEVKALEVELGEKLTFGGPRGCLQGRAKVAEEHRHRTFMGYLPDNEERLQFFSARQVACRILGCRGYLCKDCWLPLADCMCAKVKKFPLWSGIQLWIYMHPKDFLRKNNSGKLLWQVFGNDSTHLCVCGIEEQENAMWEAFRQSGQGSIWYLYPEQGNTHINEINLPRQIKSQMLECGKTKTTLNFILIDGTWTNSKMMVNRLQDRAGVTWKDQRMQSLSLTPEKHSVLHGLRPQPSLDRTCTAAATAQLLRELDLKDELSGCELGQAAAALDEGLKELLQALTIRLEKSGRAGKLTQYFSNF